MKENNEFKIEKGILYEEVKKSNRGKSKYPFSKMEVGDSFVVCDYTEKKRSVMASQVSAYGKKYMNGAKFKCCNHNGKLRVWRVK